MEAFTLAAISLTIAVSLLIRKKKNPLYAWFSALCIALFFFEVGAFFSGATEGGFWAVIHYMGALAIPPFCIRLQPVLSQQQAFFTQNGDRAGEHRKPRHSPRIPDPAVEMDPKSIAHPYYYIGLTLVYCCGILFYSIRYKVPETDKKRTAYVLIACLIAGFLSLFDLLAMAGVGIPHLAAMAVSALLYFILIVITTPNSPSSMK